MAHHECILQPIDSRTAVPQDPETPEAPRGLTVEELLSARDAEWETRIEAVRVGAVETLARREAELGAERDEAVRAAREQVLTEAATRFEERSATAFAALAEAVVQTEAAAERAARDVAPLALRLALALGEKVVGAELRTNPDVVRSVLESALREARGREVSRIRLNPADLETARAHLAETAAAGAPLAPDPEIGPGGCVVETDQGAFATRLTRFGGTPMPPTLESFDTLVERVRSAPAGRWTGRVSEVIGLTIASRGPVARIGEHCVVHRHDGDPLPAEVVGFRGGHTLLMPLGDTPPPHGEIERIVNLAKLARSEGILAIENQLEDVKDPFLSKGLQLVVDGTDPEALRNILTTELDFMRARHGEGKKVLDAMGAFAPAFGMVGALIGLIQMLQDLDDPSKIGGGMAVALLTTFYGALAANLFFLPMAGKLDSRSKEECLMKEMLIEGIGAIQSGDNPRLIQEKLKSFLPPAQRGMVAAQGKHGASDMAA